MSSSRDFRTTLGKMFYGGFFSALSLVVALAPAAAETITIKILPSPSRFESPVKAKVGDIIQWKNETTADHTATPKDNKDSFKGNPKEIAPNTTSPPSAAIADAPRTIAYQCDIHPSMTGEIVVEAAAK